MTLNENMGAEDQTNPREIIPPIENSNPLEKKRWLSNFFEDFMKRFSRVEKEAEDNGAVKLEQVKTTEGATPKDIESGKKIVNEATGKITNGSIEAQEKIGEVVGLELDSSPESAQVKQNSNTRLDSINNELREVESALTSKDRKGKNETKGKGRKDLKLRRSQLRREKEGIILSSENNSTVLATDAEVESLDKLIADTQISGTAQESADKNSLLPETQRGIVLAANKRKRLQGQGFTQTKANDEIAVVHGIVEDSQEGLNLNPKNIIDAKFRDSAKESVEGINSPEVAKKNILRQGVELAGTLLKTKEGRKMVGNLSFEASYAGLTQAFGVKFVTDLVRAFKWKNGDLYKWYQDTFSQEEGSEKRGIRGRREAMNNIAKGEGAVEEKIAQLEKKLINLPENQRQEYLGKMRLLMEKREKIKLDNAGDLMNETEKLFLKQAETLTKGYVKKRVSNISVARDAMAPLMYIVVPPPIAIALRGYMYFGAGSGMLLEKGIARHRQKAIEYQDESKITKTANIIKEATVGSVIDAYNLLIKKKEGPEGAKRGFVELAQALPVALQLYAAIRLSGGVAESFHKIEDYVSNIGSNIHQAGAGNYIENMSLIADTYKNIGSKIFSPKEVHANEITYPIPNGKNEPTIEMPKPTKISQVEADLGKFETHHVTGGKGGSVAEAIPPVPGGAKTQNLAENLVIIKKGQGVEHALKRQIEANPEVYGYKGKAGDASAIRHFSETKAHQAAIKNNLFEDGSSQLTKTGDKVILNPDGTVTHLSKGGTPAAHHLIKDMPLKPKGEVKPEEILKSETHSVAEQTVVGSGEVKQPDYNELLRQGKINKSEINRSLSGDDDQLKGARGKPINAEEWARAHQEAMAGKPKGGGQTADQLIHKETMSQGREGQVVASEQWLKEWRQEHPFASLEDHAWSMKVAPYIGTETNLSHLDKIGFAKMEQENLIKVLTGDNGPAKGTNLDNIKLTWQKDGCLKADWLDSTGHSRQVTNIQEKISATGSSKFVFHDQGVVEADNPPQITNEAVGGQAKKSVDMEEWNQGHQKAIANQDHIQSGPVEIFDGKKMGVEYLTKNNWFDRVNYLKNQCGEQGLSYKTDQGELVVAVSKSVYPGELCYSINGKEPIPINSEEAERLFKDLAYPEK